MIGFCLPKRSAENFQLRLANRTQAPPMIMVRAAETANGLSPLVFMDRGVKINAEYYRENALRTVLEPWADKHFSRRPWRFQQESAPPHSARGNQEWLKKVVLRFISTVQWPRKSLSWGILESRVLIRNTKVPTTLRGEWTKIPQNHLRAACNGFIGRLKTIIRTKYGQFEQI